jgi:hypothetical protein
VVCRESTNVSEEHIASIFEHRNDSIIVNAELGRMMKKAWRILMCYIGIGITGLFENRSSET